MPNPIILEWKTDPSQIRETLETLKQMGIVGQDLVDEAKKVEAAYAKQSETLKKTGQATDELRVDMNELIESIRKVPDSIIEEQAVKVVKEAGIAAEKTGKQNERMSRQLRNVREEMQRLEQAGQRNTTQWRNLAQQAAQMEDQIADTTTQIRILASDTANIDGLVDGVTGLAGGFTAVQGAAALFGGENEELQKSLLKVNAAMAITQGLQQVQLTLNKDSAFSIVILGQAQAAWNAYMGTSVGLMKALKIALAGLGIGVIVAAIAAAYQAWDRWNKKMEEAKYTIDGVVYSQEQFNDVQTASANAISNTTTEMNALLRVARDDKSSKDAQAEAIKQLNDKYGDYIGNLTLENINSQEINEKITKYIELQGLKAKAQAMYDIMVQNNKDFYEKQVELEAVRNDQARDFIAIVNDSTTSEKSKERAQRLINIANNQYLHDLKKLKTEMAQRNSLESAYQEITAQILELESQSAVSKDTKTSNTKKEASAVKDVVTGYEGLMEILRAMRQEEIEADVLRELFDGTQFTAEDVSVDSLLKVPTDYYKRLKKLQADYQDTGREQSINDLREYYDSWQEKISIAQAAISTLSDISGSFYSRETTLLENQLKQQLITQEQYEKGIAEAKTRRAKQDKALAFFQTVINTARGVVDAIAESPLTFGLPWSAFIGVQGAIQGGLILSQPIPQYATGTKSAAPGWKLVGEQGPELIYDGGGYPVINHDDMLNLAGVLANYGISMPSATGDKKKARKQAEMMHSPSLYINIDENGFEKRLIKGIHRTLSLDKRYSSKL